MVARGPPEPTGDEPQALRDVVRSAGSGRCTSRRCASVALFVPFVFLPTAAVADGCRRSQRRPDRRDRCGERRRAPRDRRAGRSGQACADVPGLFAILATSFGSGWSARLAWLLAFAVVLGTGYGG
jgi:hypothetical protein